MTYSLISALTLFALVSSITPGPNNLMLLTSGANFGVRRTLPHATGVVLGFMFMIAIMGLGAGQLFEIYPGLHKPFTLICAAYLLFLAYKIATATPVIAKPENAGTPITFLQAAAFQWVNPKAWSMALTATTLYTPQPATTSHILIVTLIFGLMNLPSICVWMVMGVQLRKFLTTQGRLRAFNGCMALLLVISIYPVVF